MYKFRILLIYILLFIMVMLAGQGCGFYEKPIRDDRGIAFFLTRTETCIENADWEQAQSSVQQLENAWGADRERLKNQRTAEEVRDFDASLDNLKEAIKHRDRGKALGNISSLKNTYRNISSP